MGIQNLMHNLAPHGRRKRWTAHTAAHYPKVIIDGPAFAYFIYGRVVAKQHSESGLPLTLIPTYEDIAVEAVQYLQALEEIGLKIRKIYFDGFLPSSKTYTRLGRLSEAVSVLDRFRKAFPSVIGQHESLFSSRSSSKSSNVQRPKPPFLVLAVFEALLNSDFGGLTETVPVEADTICARTSTARDLILTNDTDLIVLRPRGKVAFLTECYLTKNEKQGQEGSDFECTIFDTQKLCESLNCPDLVQAAFWLSEHPLKSLSQCAQWVREGVLTGPDVPRFNTFQEQYSLDIVFSDFPDHFDSAVLNNSLKPLLRVLDSRTSELVYSALSSSTGNSDTIDVTFPPLIEDTAQLSAWLPSRDIRKLVYVLLNRCSVSRRLFSEIYRKGANQLAHVHVDDTISLQHLRQEFEELRQGLKIDYAGVVEGSHYAWRCICLRYTIKSLRRKEDSVPSIDLMEGLIGKTVGDLSWEHTHISAMAEGVLYSLRMLRQIGQIYLVMVDTGTVTENKSLVVAVRNLVNILDSMPSLPEILIRSGWFLPLGGYEDLFLHSLEHEFSLVRQPITASKSKSRRVRDPDGGGGGKSPKSLRANASRNIYNALSIE